LFHLRLGLYGRNPGVISALIAVDTARDAGPVTDVGEVKNVVLVERKADPRHVHAVGGLNLKRKEKQFLLSKLKYRSYIAVYMRFGTLYNTIHQQVCCAHLLENQLANASLLIQDFRFYRILMCKSAILKQGGQSFKIEKKKIKKNQICQICVKYFLYHSATRRNLMGK
jgi:hypothetical protein